MIWIIFLLGIALGSFVNALVWRVYQQSLSAKKRVASDARLSLSKGRSMCTHCQHELAWYDLLPVISWLSLAGKCRYCRQSIGWQYPAVEIVTAVLFVVSYMYWPQELLGVTYQLSFALWLAAIVGLVALFVYDARWMLLPDRIVFPLIGLASVYAVLQIIAQSSIGTAAAIAGSVFVSSGIFYILYQVSAGRWIGGGDVKMGIALGLFLCSPVLACLMLFTASLLGIVYALITGLAKSQKIKVVPFGPMLILATYITMLWGSRIVDWYFNTILTIAI